MSSSKLWQSWRGRAWAWPLVVVVTALVVPRVSSALAVAEGESPTPVASGDLVLVEPEDRAQPMVSGRSSTEFSVRLPDSAACPGDSLHDQWRIQSFIVPAADEIGELEYGVIGPQGPQQFALYSLDTRPYTDRLTRANSSPGEPGVIAEVPTFSFAIFPPGTLKPGSYRMGIACTYFRSTANYWSVEVVVAADASDAPGQMSWRLASAPDAQHSAQGGSSSFARVASAAAVVLLVVLFFSLWRRSVARRAPSVKGNRSTKESK